MLAAGPYRWQAHELTALGVATNRVTFGAYRAPDAPPAAFAVESLIDELAAPAGDGPARAAAAQRRRRGRPGAAGQEFPVFGARECLERLRDHPLWARARLSSPTARGSASRSDGGRAATSPRPRSAGWTPTAT